MNSLIQRILTVTKTLSPTSFRLPSASLQLEKLFLVNPQFSTSATAALTTSSCHHPTLMAKKVKRGAVADTRKHKKNWEINYEKKIAERASRPPKMIADIKSGPGVPFNELPIVCVKATYNNTLCTLTDHHGLVGAIVTGGTIGFKNAKRGTNYAGEAAAQQLAEKTKEQFSVDRVRVKLKGMGPGRQSAVKGLVNAGLEVVSITDTTAVPHNGPRPKKARRL